MESSSEVIGCVCMYRGKNKKQEKKFFPFFEFSYFSLTCFFFASLSSGCCLRGRGVENGVKRCGSVHIMKNKFYIVRWEDKLHLGRPLKAFPIRSMWKEREWKCDVRWKMKKKIKNFFPNGKCTSKKATQHNSKQSKYKKNSSQVPSTRRKSLLNSINKLFHFLCTRRGVCGRVQYELLLACSPNRVLQHPSFLCDVCAAEL